MPLVSRPGMTPRPIRPLPPPTRARLQRLLTASIQALRRGRSAARAPARVITKPLPERIAPAASVRGDRRAKTGCYRRGQAVGPDLAPWPDRPQGRAALKPRQIPLTAKAQVAGNSLVFHRPPARHVFKERRYFPPAQTPTVWSHRRGYRSPASGSARKHPPVHHRRW